MTGFASLWILSVMVRGQRGQKVVMMAKMLNILDVKSEYTDTRARQIQLSYIWKSINQINHPIN